MPTRRGQPVDGGGDETHHGHVLLDKQIDSSSEKPFSPDVKVWTEKIGGPDGLHASGDTDGHTRRRQGSCG
jgi:hypothetical protein